MPGQVRRVVEPLPLKRLRVEKPVSGVVSESKELVLADVTTTSYTMTDTDEMLTVDDDTAGGDVTITLPAVATARKTARNIKKLGTTGKVILDPNASELIDDDTTLELLFKDECVSIYADGSQWRVLS